MTVHSKFQRINFPAFRLAFDLGPTEDERGIGRVSRSMLEALTRRSAGSENHKSVQTIYFYPSIHWCPETLPERSIVMIHDTIPLSLKYYFNQNQDQWLYDFGAIASQANRIVTISEHSKSEIVKHLFVDPHLISVVPNGVKPLGIPDEKSSDVKIPPLPFVTYLGAGDLHKNIDVVIEALVHNSENDIGLAVIGSASDDVLDRARIWGLNPDLVFPMGRLSDERIATVLASSIALVMPSLQEGFGLPPLEAGLLKVPSICSDRPAHNELMVDAALFVDPFLPRDWLAAIRRLQCDTGLSKHLASAAENKALSWTWDQNALVLIDLFSRFSEELV